MKLPAFPQTIGDGNARVKIYHLKRGTYHEFKVAYFHEGKRKTQTFAEYDKAKARADAINDSVNSGQVEALSLSRSQLQDFQQATDILASTGLSLASIATQFAEARKVLGNATILEAAQFYRARHRAVVPKTVSEIVKEFLARKTARGVCSRYLSIITGLLTRFATTFQCDVSSITATEIASFLGTSTKRSKYSRKGDPLRPATFNSYLRLLSEFFTYAIRKNYLPPDWAELKEFEQRMKTPEPVEIYTPKEIVRLLSAFSYTDVAPESLTDHKKRRAFYRWGQHNRETAQAMQIYLALGAFTGLRRTEILQLRWEDVGVGSGAKYIEVKAKNAKTRCRRLVPITENLKAWIGPYTKTEGPVFQFPSFESIYSPIKKLCARIGLPWKSNALRHSYISYRVAQTSDVAKISLEAGNSPQVIFRHYRELVTPEAAADWFAIMPSEASDKITYLKTAAV